MRCRSYCLLFVLLLALFAGCSSSHLSHDKMVDLLFDIHLAEATIKVRVYNYRTIEKQEYYNRIFEKHGVTKEEFEASLDWYSQHPDRLVRIYEDLKTKVSDFQARVEHYEFHPDEIPTRQDSLSTLDVWCWRRKQTLTARKRKKISPDSLHFVFENPDYFAPADEVDFRMQMRAYSPDSAIYRTMLVAHYNDSLSDTLACFSLADSLTRRFHFHKLMPDSMALQRMEVILIDSLYSINRVEIDSLSLERTFNRYDHPLDYKIEREIKAANDSIGKLGIKKKKAKKRKTV